MVMREVINLTSSWSWGVACFASKEEEDRFKAEYSSEIASSLSASTTTMVDLKSITPSLGGETGLLLLLLKVKLGTEILEPPATEFKFNSQGRPPCLIGIKPQLDVVFGPNTHTNPEITTNGTINNKRVVDDEEYQHAHHFLLLFPIVISLSLSISIYRKIPHFEEIKTLAYRLYSKVVHLAIEDRLSISLCLCVEGFVVRLPKPEGFGVRVLWRATFGNKWLRHQAKRPPLSPSISEFLMQLSFFPFLPLFPFNSTDLSD